MVAEDGILILLQLYNRPLNVIVREIATEKALPPDQIGF